MDNKILVVRTTAYLTNKEMRKIYEQICQQKKSGFILLPAYCEVQVVPDNAKIIMSDAEGKILKLTDSAKGS